MNTLVAVAAADDDDECDVIASYLEYLLLINMGFCLFSPTRSSSLFIYLFHNKIWVTFHKSNSSTTRL